MLVNYLNMIPDDNNTNLRVYILDPLSVIIKLAIISNKPVGTKLRIDNNMIYIQEPGPFQAFCRYIFRSNKTDIQYLYNAIEIACNKYLNEQSMKDYPKMKDLFVCAQNGILRLIETYRSCSVMRLCLNYYLSLISNHLDKKNNEGLFRNDGMTPFYNNETITKLSKVWSGEKIRIVLNLTTFLVNDSNAETNVKSLETIMDGIDKCVNQTL